MRIHVALSILLTCSVAFAQHGGNDTVSSTNMGPITGAGTAHYIPIFSGPTTIRNSTVFETSTASVGIGTTTPAATLDVNGTINAMSGFDLSGSPFAFGSTINGSVFIGFAGSSISAQSYDNTAVGYQALPANTLGSQNSAMGYQALFANTEGVQNTALGYQTLLSNTTGGQNVAIGPSTLSYNTTGSGNIAIGPGLPINTIGSNNIAIGSNMQQNTQGSENVAIGSDTITNSNSGNDNTAVGYGALASNPCDATYNTAVGYQAGYLSVSVAQCGLGNSNTYLGANTRPTDLRFNNSTAIGANAEVTASNSMVLGGISGVNGATSNTNVGVGTTAPSNIFTIGRGFGEALADGWSTYSSRRWKTDIETLPDALAKVKQLRGVSYDLIGTGKHEIGLIAEEVGKVVPEVVTYEEGQKDARGLDYGRLTALLIEAIKEQQEIILKQEQQMQAQQIRLDELTSRVGKIEYAGTGDTGKPYSLITNTRVLTSQK